ncbi:MAG: PEP-CTERM sorting domain-containing protein [Candidatus Omnitrophica bacterium]|nr:PEP-CTERM sorting domain-containing protein [Candidatus Omnitrophota bacterium]
MSILAITILTFAINASKSEAFIVSGDENSAMPESATQTVSVGTINEGDRIIVPPDPCFPNACPSTPEPASLLLLSSGLVGILLRKKLA